MKKFLMPALIAIIVIQLFVPVCRTINKYYILKVGEELKFRVNPVDPYDAFRGRYVSIFSRQEVSGNGKYGIVIVDSEGFARIASISDEKPVSGVYIKSNSSNNFSLPISRYYMDEKLASKAENLTRQGGQEAYVTVRVKNGVLVISGLYINGITIEDIIKLEQ